jgi:hypothetical protein
MQGSSPLTPDPGEHIQRYRDDEDLRMVVDQEMDASKGNLQFLNIFHFPRDTCAMRIACIFPAAWLRGLMT